jgi:hypothetical protein
MNESQALARIMEAFGIIDQEERRKVIRLVLSEFGSTKYSQGYDDGMWRE